MPASNSFETLELVLLSSQFIQQSRFLLRRALALSAFVMAAFLSVSAAARSHFPAEVRSIHIVPGDHGPVLQIVSSRPLTPKLQIVDGPLRLVVDLPGTMSGAIRKKIAFRNEQIKDIRANQYQNEPAVTRIVVDLTAPVRYNWDAIGNQLNIRIRPDEAATAKPVSVPALTAGVQPVAVPFSEGASGALVEAGNRVSSGSSITAGEQTALLRLTRGGEVRVCPGTTVSVSTSPGGEDLMLGMSTGAMETHYHLEESSDSVLTPDFRIVFPGPGEFNFAISADTHGNTCVSAMPGSSSSVIVAELLGNGTYEIKPDKHAMFHRGSLETVEQPLAPCGCPARQEPVFRASADLNAIVPDAQAGSKLTMANSTENAGEKPGTSVTSDPMDSPETRPLPQTKSSEMKVELEAPLVFSGKERAQARALAAPVLEAAALPLSAREAKPLPAVVVLPPESKQAHKGFFGRVKGFFGSIFR